MKPEIPIFFSADDHYIPFLDVAIASLLDNASHDYAYRIVVLNTGLNADNVARVKLRERPGVQIDFVDITSRTASIASRFRNVYHFSIATYYRLFIASLFPEYDKIIYLDCDLIVRGDISELFFTDIGDAILGAAPEEFVQNTLEFRTYSREALGVDPDHYVNAGVLLMNLKAFRAHRIEEQFVFLIGQYDFDLLDPDQAYLNYLCRGKIQMLPNGWNKEPLDVKCEGEKNVVHYALYKKPWQFDDMTDGEYFWQYARLSPFYGEILKERESFGEQQRKEKEATAAEILVHAKRIVASGYTFSKILKG